MKSQSSKPKVVVMSKYKYYYKFPIYDNRPRDYYRVDEKEKWTILSPRIIGSNSIIWAEIPNYNFSLYQHHFTSVNAILYYINL